MPSTENALEHNLGSSVFAYSQHKLTVGRVIDILCD